MRITFVEPQPPGLHIWTRFSLPRLGPVLLGTVLAQHGHDVRVLFEEGHGLDWERLESSQLVGVSTTTSTAPHGYAIADRLRRVGVPVVIGGPHATFCADEALAHADWVLRGEADDTIVPFVAGVAGEGDLAAVPGLTWREDGRTVHNPLPPLVVDLDRLPAPDLGLLGKPFKRSFAQDPVVPVLTSRGCPYDCSFCSVTAMFGRRYRFRSAGSVVAELAARGTDGRRVFFYDDNFTANPRRTTELLEAMIAAGTTPPWSAQVAVDCARHPELLALMRHAGGDTLFIGLESVNPATLAAYNKHQSVADMEAALAEIHRHGFHVHGMFVLGADDDTPESIRETARWARAQGLYSVQLLILTPLPGTRVYAELAAEERLLDCGWELYDSHHAVFRPSRLEPEELVEAVFAAQGRFYSWGQVVRPLLAFDLDHALIRLYAHLLNRRWLRQHRRERERLSGLPGRG